MCGCLSRTPYWGPGPQPGTGPDWEPNWWPFVHRLAFNPLSHTSQGSSYTEFKCPETHPVDATEARTTMAWALGPGAQDRGKGMPKSWC